jgi:two-component system nitrogen regulation sensor histidine kinase NtrY
VRLRTDGAEKRLQAIDGAGTVTIRLTSGTGRPTLMIEDTGAGLSPEAQTNLFTPFFSTKPRGQGIGLTLVQEVLAGHGFVTAGGLPCSP